MPAAAPGPIGLHGIRTDGVLQSRRSFSLTAVIAGSSSLDSTMGLTSSPTNVSRPRLPG